MKIVIQLDVSQTNQFAMANVSQCGEYTSVIYIPMSDQKRYAITVEVPHPTDAEPLGGTFQEVTYEPPIITTTKD